MTGFGLEDFGVELAVGDDEGNGLVVGLGLEVGDADGEIVGRGLAVGEELGAGLGVGFEVPAVATTVLRSREFK